MAGRVDSAVAGRSFLVRWLLGIVYWFFPLVLMGVGYLIGHFIPAFRVSVFHSLPPDASVWPPLLLIIILAIIWLLFDLFYVFNRETSARNLQLNLTLSVLLAISLSFAFGYLFNNKFGVAWWFVVPYFAAVVDAFTTG